MKILRSNVNDKTREGSVQIQPERDEDMYSLYNLILKGDLVEAMTIRNVITESKSGARDKTRVQTRICIRVETVSFDREHCGLRLNGNNVKENEHIKIGQYHTIEIELNRPFTLSKEHWDNISLELLQDLSNPVNHAELAAMTIEETFATLTLIQDAMTRYCFRVEKSASKKKSFGGGGGGLDKPTTKYYTDTYDALMKHLDFEAMKVLIIGSSTTVVDEFFEFAVQKSIGDENLFHKNRSKVLKVRTTPGSKNPIQEMFSNPDIMSRLTDVKAISEVRVFKQFTEMLDNDSHRACYGLQHVISANEQLAIQDLLIIDKMYRSDDYDERNKFVELIDSVKYSGGQVYKFSSLHPSGEALANYTGIAAILRFPIYDEEEIAEAVKG